MFPSLEARLPCCSQSVLIAIEWSRRWSGPVESAQEFFPRQCLVAAPELTKVFRLVEGLANLR